MISNQNTQLLWSLLTDYDTPFRGTINNREGISLHAGFYASVLQSVGGISIEKMPLVIGLIFTMFFGLQTEEIYKYIMPSSTTLSVAADRALAIQNNQSKDLFINNNHPRSYKSVTLMLDASNKANRDLVAKVCIGPCQDGITRAFLLNADHTVTKKGLVGAHLTIQSLTHEVMDCVINI